MTDVWAGSMNLKTLFFPQKGEERRGEERRGEEWGGIILSTAGSSLHSSAFQAETGSRVRDAMLRVVAWSCEGEGEGEGEGEDQEEEEEEEDQEEEEEQPGRGGQRRARCAKRVGRQSCCREMPGAAILEEAQVPMIPWVETAW
jgi:hypothetical protein